MKPKVVVFGIDGVRLDTLRQATTPGIDTIADHGFLTPVRIPDINPTVSGPCWATIATGVLADTHHITSNKLHNNALDQHPCFLTRAHAAGLNTYAAAGWLPLLTDYSGGPIFRPQQQYTPPRPGGSKTGGDAESDQKVADAASTALQHQDPDISFIYFGQVDETGHAHGIGEDYNQAIKNADACLSQVCDAITARDTYHHEQWTYLIVTDHGHRDEGGHGGDSDLERTAWIAAAGTHITPHTANNLALADVSRLALRPFADRLT